MTGTRPYVLVVDDLPDAADSLADLIDLWGYDADAHYGGSSALAAAAARRPVVVILDIAMARMDGFAFAALLRELPGCATTAVVAVSGHTGAAYQTRCCELGIGHYLFKPVVPAVVRALLDGRVADDGDSRPRPAACSREACDFLGKMSAASEWAGP